MEPGAISTRPDLSVSSEKNIFFSERGALNRVVGQCPTPSLLKLEPVLEFEELEGEDLGPSRTEGSALS